VTAILFIPGQTEGGEKCSRENSVQTVRIALGIRSRMTGAHGLFLLQTMDFVWEVTLALNLTFSPRRRNRVSHVSFFGSRPANPATGFSKDAGNVKSKSQIWFLRISIFLPLFAKNALDGPDKCV
jgi:hypothetical protein